MIGLYNLGLSEEQIIEIININSNISYLNLEEILKSIKILKDISCSDKTIKDIILTNPFYLNRSIDDVLNLINKLMDFGIKDISSLIENNPFLLNKDAFEIDEFVKFKMDSGKSKKEIIDEFITNPYIIDEM